VTDVSVANKQRRTNGQGSIYWDPKRKRWVASAFDIHNKRHSRFFKRKLNLGDGPTLKSLPNPLPYLVTYIRSDRVLGNSPKYCYQARDPA